MYEGRICTEQSGICQIVYYEIYSNIRNGSKHCMSKYTDLKVKNVIFISYSYPEI